MEYKDYYRILGVPKSASEKELRSAYRKLARQYHPDVNPGNSEAEQRFKEINEAYEVLADAERRKRYDVLGERWQEYEAWVRAHEGSQAPAPPSPEEFLAQTRAAAGGGPAGYRTLSEEDLQDLFGDASPFSDFFYDFVAGGRRGAHRTGPRRGAHLEQPVDVTLAEAYRGATRTLTPAGADGAPRRLEVHIPPGVDTGSTIRLAGQGVPGENGGPPGDLYVVVRVRPDPRFERRGADLHTRVRVPLGRMLLGAELLGPKPDGGAWRCACPRRRRTGARSASRGRGCPCWRAPTGGPISTPRRTSPSPNG